MNAPAIPAPYLTISSYSDVTCDGVPEYVTVRSHGNMTYLSFEGTQTGLPGNATRVEFNNYRVVLHLDTNGDWKPDHKTEYRDCSIKITERGALGSADVDCDGEQERVHLKARKEENKTTLDICKSGGTCMTPITLRGYPVGDIVIGPEQVHFSLDTDKDGLPDEEYGHECDEIPDLPYLIPEEKKEPMHI